ncbi:RtcB family protein [Enteractinococcus coprophilus]|nr:RtcB family protein [Enteractinococcus coprophilus]
MERINDQLVSWASILEEETRQQAITSAELDFIYPHIALMPDAHLGYGATVGSVIPTLGAVMPAAVGVDIGCGMIAVQTQFTFNDLPKDLKTLREQIERAIPVSAGQYNRKILPTAKPRIDELETMALEIDFDPDAFDKNWRVQLGTLGGGNHFIEVCLDDHDNVWTFLHSGSRGIGNKIATHHIAIAKRLRRAAGDTMPHEDLAWFEEGTPEFDQYVDHLHWAQHFALLNREEMMDRVNEQLGRWAGESVRDIQRINSHHNFTEKEEHFGKEVWVTRKGAIRARKGDLASIPGSMGAASYIVEGKGNPDALDSAPHGAGRQYSRRAARRAFTQDDLRKAMVGIEYRDTHKFIDEIPQAYKPIDRVMADSTELVAIRHTLRQIVNVKGD